jgi:predicted PurR-regulated permease PerM
MRSDIPLDRRTIFTASAIFFVVGLLVVAIGYLAIRLREILILLLLATILATGLEPLVRRLERRSVLRVLSRPRAVALVFAGMLALATVLIAMIGVPAAAQVRAFFQDSGRYVAMAQTRWQAVRGLAPWLPDLAWIAERAQAWLREEGRAGAFVARYGLELLGQLSGVATMLLFTLYLLLQPPRPSRFLEGAVPPARRRALRRAFAEVGEKLQQWLRAQFLLSASVGVATFAGMLAAGMPFPHLFALVAAIGEVFPIVGPILSALPAVVVGFALYTEQGLAMIALAFVIQMLENYLLVPMIMRRVVGVPPLVTIVGLMVGFELYGVLGAVLAVPVAAALGILVPHLAGALIDSEPLGAPPDPPSPAAPAAAPADRAPRREPPP